ncbi:MAG: hypothetical protein ACPHM3_04630 [Candidatus Kariarchaeum pelagius]
MSYSSMSSKITPTTKSKCDQCNQPNLPSDKFCIECGALLKMKPNHHTTKNKTVPPTIYKTWLFSLPFNISTCLFLLIIDLLTGDGIGWSLYAIIPISLFAIISPFISFQLTKKLK